MQQRYYDPQIGRFLSTDPAESEFNRYSYAANNPYKFTDPDGREVYARYDLRTGRLSVSELDKGIMIEVDAESGGKPWGDPIPEGEYDILDHPDADFVRLEPLDENYGDDSQPDPDGDGVRTELRLHYPGRGNTTGCIKVCTIKEWAKVKQLVRGTKSTIRTVKSKSRNPLNKSKTENVRRFGRLRVIRTPPPPKPRKPRPKGKLDAGG